MLRNRISSTERTLVLLAALLTITAASAPAQQPPTPPAEIARITVLAGTFDGSARYTTGGKTVRFSLRHVNRVIAGGFGLDSHESAELPEMGHYEAENLFGWDSGRRMLHLFSVTNDPNTHDHSGPWRDATHVTLQYEGLRGGKRIVEVIPFEIVGPDEYRFRSTTTVEGQAPEIFEATMKRVEGLAGK